VLLTSSARILGEVLEIDPEEQWVLEVQSWFERALLRLRFLTLASLEPKPRDPQYPC